MVKARSETGATLAEYAIGLAALVVIFVAASSILESAGKARVESSVDTVNTMIPCVRYIDDSGQEKWSLDGKPSSNEAECM